MNFSSDAMADFEGLLEVNRKICKQQMAEKELCGSAIAFIYKAVHNSCQFSPRQLFRFNSIMCGLPSVTNEESIVQCAIE